MNLRRSCLRAYPIFTALALPFLAACGQDGVQIIHRPDPVIPETEGDAEIGVVVQSALSADVANVNVTVTSSDLSVQIGQDLSKTNGQWRGTIQHIPFGDCLFHVQAFDATNKVMAQQKISSAVADGAFPIVLAVLQNDGLIDPLTNHSPRIHSLVASPKQLQPGGDLYAVMDADDIDGNPLMYRWSEGAGVLVDSTVSSLVWQAPGAPGDFELHVEARDDQNTTAGISLTVEVGSSGASQSGPLFNVWPILEQVLPNAEFVESGKTTSVNATAVDAEAEALTYAWSDDCGGSFDDKLAMKPVWKAPNVSTDTACVLALTVKDPHGAMAQGSHKVNVYASNLPPIIDETYQSHAALNLGGKIHLRVRVHDPESDALLFGWVATDGNIETPTSSATQSDVEWSAPNVAGVYEVQAVVDDSKNGIAKQTFSIEVKDVAPPATPITLASGLVQPGAIASDGMNVFWLTAGSAEPMNPGGTVMRCGIEGCNGLPTVLAHGQFAPQRMALDATTIYWTMKGTNASGTDGALRWCEKIGCFDMPAYWEGGVLNRAIAVYGNNLYWSIEQNGTTTIRTSPLIGPWTPQDLATFAGSAVDMAVNDWGLSWTEAAPHNAIGQLSPPGPGMVSVPVGGQMNAPVAVAMDDTNTYWIAGTSIFACALSGCGGTPTTLVTGLDTPTAIATDGVNLYFTLVPMGPGAVMKCPVTGGTPVTMAAGANVMSPGAIAVDATSIYWTDVAAGTATRMAK